MNPQERAADAAVAVSVGGWLTSWAVDALPVIQALAGMVSIVAAGFAIAYYVQRLTRRD